MPSIGSVPTIGTTSNPENKDIEGKRDPNTVYTSYTSKGCNYYKQIWKIL